MSFVDAKLADGQLDGFQHDGMPDDRDTWRQVAHGLDQAARRHGETTFAARRRADAARDRRRLRGRRADRRIWDRAARATAWTVVMRSVLSAFYSHPWAWNEIGFGGPAYPRGYMRLAEGPAGAEPDEARRGVRTRPRRGRPATGDAMRTRSSGWPRAPSAPRTTTRASCSMSIAAAFPAGRTMATLPRRGRGRPGDRRRGRGRQHAGPAARAARLADRGPRVGARSGTPIATGSPTRPAATSSTGPPSG